MKKWRTAPLGNIARHWHPLAFALVPLAFILGANESRLAIGPSFAIRPALALTVAALAGLAFFRLLSRDLPTAALRLTFFLLLATFLYPVLDARLEPWYRHGALSAGIVAFVFAPAAMACAAWIGGRIGNSRLRVSVIAALNATGAVLLLLNAGLVVAAGRSAPGKPVSAHEDERTLVPAANAPHTIVYLVPDGLARFDVLREYYGVDTRPFERALSDRGFHVPAASRANYSQTYLSLASSLNMMYLDEVAREHTGSEDRRPLGRLIQQSRALRLLEQAGYSIQWIGSEYSATSVNPFASHCECASSGLSELEAAVLLWTPLKYYPFDRLTFGAHRQNVQRAFDAVPRLARAGQRRVVFAHVLSPHPPFVFDAEGRVLTPEDTYSFDDGDQFRPGAEEYRRGYRAQAMWVLRQILATADRIVEADPNAVILVQSDHGPGSRLHQKDPATSDSRERLANFIALRLPGDNAAPPDDLSAVNTLRLILSEYFEAGLTPLPNRSFISAMKRPYEFVTVESSRLAATRPNQVKSAALDIP